MKREKLIVELISVKYLNDVITWGQVKQALESLSPSPQPSATAEKKPPHAQSSMDFLSILTKWCEYYDVSFSGRETAVIESAVHEYAAKPVAEREVPEEKYPPAPTSHI